MWEFFPPGQPLEGMIHPWVVAIWNYQEVVDPSSAPQELNPSPVVLCILVVRVVETRGVYDCALSPICDPETRDLTGLFGARGCLTALFEPSG